MKIGWTVVAAVAALAGAAHAEPAAWPSDLKQALQGKWVAERNARAIEIVGDQVFIRNSSQFNDTYYGPVGSVMATVGSEDSARASDYHRYFTGTCINASTSFQPSRCTSYINQPPGPKNS